MGYSTESSPSAGGGSDGADSGGSAGSGVDAGNGGAGNLGGGIGWDSGDAACEDKDQDCAGYDRSYCQAPSEFAPYMGAHCKAFCGLCSANGGGQDGGQVGGGQSACQDKDQACASYDSNYCRAPSEFAPYMEDNCARICG